MGRKLKLSVSISPQNSQENARSLSSRKPDNPEETEGL